MVASGIACERWTDESLGSSLWRTDCNSNEQKWPLENIIEILIIVSQFPWALMPECMVQYSFFSGTIGCSNIILATRLWSGDLSYYSLHPYPQSFRTCCLEFFKKSKNATTKSSNGWWWEKEHFDLGTKIWDQPENLSLSLFMSSQFITWCFVISYSLHLVPRCERPWV